jgi:MFS transporter, DHA1 family, inner membrane transport protein
MQQITLSRRIQTQAALLTANRTVINTGFRMLYPLLPVFARGVGVEIGQIATVLTFTQLVGLAAPVMGELAERRSKRFNILLGLGVNVLGLGLVFVLPGFAGLTAALLLVAVGKNTLYDPAAIAYIGDRVPYQRRGLVMGAMELSWSMAFLLGVPAMAWLIEGYGWRAPFAVLSMLSAVGLIVMAGMLEVDDSMNKRERPLWQNIGETLGTRTAIAGLVLGFGISAANQMVNVVFGAWIELSFGVALAALATASAVIGVSELVGGPDETASLSG